MSTTEDPDGQPPPRRKIIERLIRRGIPIVQTDQVLVELVAFLQNNRPLLTEVVSDILPRIEDVSNAHILESLVWLQWLMFEGEPQFFLEKLAKKAVDQRAVCGAVWGKDDLAYRCRTCEHDSTCAICVPCFQNGNHNDHDYSIIYTGGGCCDCGDITAWKREGFCSKHKGIENIQPFSEEFPDSLGPVLDALFHCWMDRLLAIKDSNKQEDNKFALWKEFTDNLTSCVADMLLMFSRCSESLLYFISKRISFSSELLQLFVEGEFFLDKAVVQKLHELLLKMLGEPTFKYEFAKAFIQYYPRIIQEAVKEHDDSVLDVYPLLPTFSVQIFTVPSLALQLVKEVNLLAILQDCLGHLFQSCAGEDSCLKAEKLYNLHVTTLRVVADMRFVLNHVDVAKYVALEQPDVIKRAIGLLIHFQGMDPQKRATSVHIEEENENLQLAFLVAHYVQIVNDLLISGALSVDDINSTKNDVSFDLGHVGLSSRRLSKVDSYSQDSSFAPLEIRANSYTIASASSDKDSSSGRFSLPSMVVSLISESLKVIEDWLEPEAAKNANGHSLKLGCTTMSNLLNLQKHIFKSRNRNSSKVVGRKRLPWKDLSDVRPMHGLDNKTGNKDENTDILAHQMEHENYHMEIDTDADILGILSSTDWPEIRFNVSLEEISFHIPLHRFLSLAIQKVMLLYHDQTCVSESDGNISIPPSPEHSFFEQILKGFHPCGFSSFIMEHPLRIRVFCAQVHAGMWRRNGDAVTLLSNWYQLVHWSNVGIETDLFLLQCCAALAPPELFVARILDRFALLGYLSLNLAEFDEYEPVLVQEMLNLLVQIVKERRFCGFSASENLQRELIQRLATGDATHSQLIKVLPRDLSKIGGIQKVVDSIATYTKPSGMKQGVYSLRKEFWKELDLYHPRWNIRDLQVAEERYLRFCKLSPLFVQVPHWTKIYSPLNSIGKIATSKMVLQIIRAVFFYAVYTEKPSVCRAPDDVLIRALHLLSLSLDVCEIQSACQIKHDPLNLDSSYSEVGFPILAHATDIVRTRTHKSPARWAHESLLSLLISLGKKHKKENDHNLVYLEGGSLSSLAKDILKRFSQLSADCMKVINKLAPDIFGDTRSSSSCDDHKPKSPATIEDMKTAARKHQAAMLEKMRAQQSKFIATLNEEEGDSGIQEGSEYQEQIAPVCSLCHDTDSDSPLSVIALLQRSCLSSLADKGAPSWEKNSQSESQNSDLSKLDGGWTTYDAIDIDIDSPIELEFSPDLQSAGSGDFAHDEDGHIQNNNQLDLSMDVDPSLPASTSELELYRYILKDMNQYSNDSKLQVVGHQPFLGSVFDGSKNCDNLSPAVISHYTSILSTVPPLPCLSLSDASSTSQPSEDNFGPLDCDGIYISSCGHAVHHKCHDRYVSSLRQRGLGFEGRRFVDPNKGEFLCPVCRRFANSIIPLLPDEPSAENNHDLLDNVLVASDDSSIITKLDSTSHIQHALSLLMSSSRILEPGRTSNIAPLKVNDVVESALAPSIYKLCELYFHQESEDAEIYRLNRSLLLWDTIRYSIVSVEIARRGKGSVKSEGLYAATEIPQLCSSSGVPLSALLRVVQTVRGCDINQLQLRYMSIQHFSTAICYGKSGAIGSSDSGRTMLRDPRHGSGLHEKFLKVAADPILIHDPFSSLMWILFALPLPFVTSVECLLSLVHLFYVVCVIQALITCFGKHQFDASKFGECILTDISRTLGKSELVQQHFVSNFVDNSCNIEDMVRKLTLPYLRKCALLWELLKLPNPISVSNNHHKVHEVSGRSYLSDPLESHFTEFGLVQLENMFHICSPDIIYNDKVVHTLATMWCEHLCEHIRGCKREHILYCNPAVPFQLMQLPLLYQDLLQRYNKEKCFNCKTVPENPALCLFCGRICSPSWKPCCSASRCHIHAESCGAGIGAFLLIRNTTILLLSLSRQSLWPSPYLDAFGEEDIDVSRGKPLYLSQERYSALTSLVASHCLNQTSEVLHRTTIIF